jgi:hypothetical protein
VIQSNIKTVDNLLKKARKKREKSIDPLGGAICGQAESLAFLKENYLHMEKDFEAGRRTIKEQKTNWW